MRRQGSLLLLLAALALPMGAASAGTPRADLSIRSASFAECSMMASKLTCDGANLSPQLQWSTPPAGTRSLAIVVEDPDAPAAFAHWLVYGIPADMRELPEGAATPSRRLTHAVEGINGFGQPGYGGPCPPEGKPHHYVFHVYALDVDVALPAGATATQVNDAIQGHVVAEGRLTGLYARGAH